MKKPEPMSEETSLIKSFIENKPLLDAVRKAVTEKIYEHGTVNGSKNNFVFSLKLDQSDEEYGRKVKTVVQALVLLEEAFNSLILKGKTGPTPSPLNESR